VSVSVLGAEAEVLSSLTSPPLKTSSRARIATTEPIASKASVGLSDLGFTALRGWLRGALTFSQHPKFTPLIYLRGQIYAIF
jgi:hypothetical protein